MTTEQWTARIEEIRSIEGFDGRIERLPILDTPILTRFIVKSDYTHCTSCGRALTERQHSRRYRRCSNACRNRAQTGVPRSGRRAS